MTDKSLERLMSLADQDLENAQLLLNNNRHRVCISRAYYDMYYATQALLRVKNIPSRSHKGMLRQFGQHFVQTGEFPTDLPGKLKENQTLRQLSDYEEDADIDEAQAIRALETAVSFVEQVRVYLKAREST